VDETFSIISAGTDTTGNALEIATYHILNDDKVYGKLTAELKEAFPDPPLTLDFVTLEKLPYLVLLAKVHYPFDWLTS
jgi:cytochrome P450